MAHHFSISNFCNLVSASGCGERPQALEVVQFTVKGFLEPLWSSLLVRFRELERLNAGVVVVDADMSTWTRWNHMVAS